MSHPTVTLTDNHGKRVEIDEQLAPLIQEIWNAGVETFDSCQHDGPGCAEIGFWSVDGLCSFLNAAVPYEAPCEDDESMYSRAAINVHRNFIPSTIWHYQPLVCNATFLDQQEPEDRIADWFVLGIQVRFPKTDIPVLLENLRRWNAQALDDDRPVD